MDTFSQEVLQEITARGAKPKARWGFLASRWAMWCLALTSIFIGAVAFSIAEFVFFDNDGITKIQGSSIQDIAQAIPFLWLAVVGIFAASAYYGFRNTRRGYKFETFRLIACVILASIALGLLFNYFDFGQRTHEYLTHKITIQGFFSPSTDGLN